METEEKYKVLDYTEVYSRIMQFNKNKTTFIHKWYSFVEGYSKEFIASVIEELDYIPELAFDPFAGSGTTPLELQDLNIKCYSCEVSPFMHQLATVKLETNYNEEKFLNSLILIANILNGNLLPIRTLMSPPKAKTFEPKENLKKWIFNKSVMDGILDIKYSIEKLEDTIYKDLFSIALASILLEVSNAYRDGKSLKYKKNWKDNIISRRDVHAKFLKKLSEIFLPDISKFTFLNPKLSNKKLCMHGDVREEIKLLDDNSIDLVITSPPYLNSRDYTDIYIAELWVLDLVKDYEELRELRKNTLRSHVQIKHGKIELIDSLELKEVIEKLECNMEDHWNVELISMIKGYFEDMQSLFIQLKKKMKPNKKIFFNVANSAYYGIEIKVDQIVAEIAEKNGFVVNEIRKARNLKPSSQQKEKINSLRETVIVLTS